MNNFNKFTNLKQDSEYSDNYTKNNFKTLKYYTNNFVQPNLKLDNLLQIQQEIINNSNELHYSQVVSDRQKTIYPPTPILTTPDMRRQGKDTAIEDTARSNYVLNKKTCRDKEIDSYNRTFQIFDTMPIKYNNYSQFGVQDSDALRGGINTRTKDYTN